MADSPRPQGNKYGNAQIADSAVAQLGDQTINVQQLVLVLGEEQATTLISSFSNLRYAQTSTTSLLPTRPDDPRRAKSNESPCEVNPRYEKRGVEDLCHNSSAGIDGKQKQKKCPAGTAATSTTSPASMSNQYLGLKWKMVCERCDVSFELLHYLNRHEQFYHNQDCAKELSLCCRVTDCRSGYEKAFSFLHLRDYVVHMEDDHDYVYDDVAAEINALTNGRYWLGELSDQQGSKIIEECSELDKALMCRP